jgi:hypothetical protein
MPYIQGIAEGHQCEYENWSDIFIKYFWNTEIKQGAMLTHIYITRVTASNICINNNLYQTNKINHRAVSLLKTYLLCP